MASQEPGKSSSSPSARITSITREGADGSVLRVRLDDGSLFLFDDPSAAAVVDACVCAGESLSSHSRKTLEAADESYRCRRKAMDLLARAEQCRKGLEAKLAKKGFSREAASSALDRLESKGFLDDRRFAEAWARSRLRSRPEGRTKLVAGLRAKGVGGNIAGEAVEAVFSDAGDAEAAEREALDRALEKLSRRPGMDGKKLTAALMRRGFSYSAVRSALSSHGVGDTSE